MPRREPRADGVVIPITGRTLDILQILAERSGIVVTKQDSVRHVHFDEVVSSNALQADTSSIRTALDANRASIK